MRIEETELLIANSYHLVCNLLNIKIVGKIYETHVIAHYNNISSYNFYLQKQKSSRHRILMAKS